MIIGELKRQKWFEAIKLPRICWNRRDADEKRYKNTHPVMCVGVKFKDPPFAKKKYRLFQNKICLLSSIFWASALYSHLIDQIKCFILDNRCIISLFFAIKSIIFTLRRGIL